MRPCSSVNLLKLTTKVCLAKVKNSDELKSVLLNQSEHPGVFLNGLISQHALGDL